MSDQAPGMDKATYDKARSAAESAWASTDRSAMGAVALAILALVDELREQRRGRG